MLAIICIRDPYEMKVECLPLSHTLERLSCYRYWLCSYQVKGMSGDSIIL